MKMWGLAVWMCSAAGAGAQSVDLPRAAPPLVNLNVVAKDARGQAVTDLTGDDFRVFEGSKAQRVVSFRPNEQTVKRVMRAGPDEYSNRTGAPMTPVTVILFDLLNARFEDRGTMMNQLGPALERVEASDTLFFYILTMNGTLYTVHGLPEGNGGKSAAAGARPWTEDSKALLDKAARELFGLRPVGVDVDTRVRMTYQALGSLADLVAAAPGRKSLIWISHGVPISLGAGSTSVYGSVDYTPLLQRLTATLDRAGAAVYTVRQPESLAPGAAAASGAAARTASASAATPDVPGITLSTEDTLEQFAQLTGGHAFMTPDIRGAIALAASDARMSYHISYEPPLGNWDGKYHKIRVSCARKGVKLETKQGYWAFADLAAPGDREKAALETVTASAFDATEIGLYARVTEHVSATRSVELAIRVETGDISFVQAGEVATGRLAVGVAGYLKDGRRELFPTEEVAPKLTAGQREEALREGLTVEKRLALAEGVEKLRVLVYDRGSGAVGSLTIPLARK
jgi:VWFA-related protein